jgi:hypothetical protein
MTARTDPIMLLVIHYEFVDSGSLSLSTKSPLIESVTTFRNSGQAAAMFDACLASFLCSLAEPNSNQTELPVP